MTGIEFNLLENINDKADLLWANSVFLDERINYNKTKVCIYSLKDFFVEVVYDIHTNEILNINALVVDSDWKGYLDSININHWIK